ncbi:MAG: MOSC domain-containing protein [Verrucomicrobiota bacterium]
MNIEEIYLSIGHDFKGRFGKGRLDHGVQEVEQVECVEGKGLKGDRFFDYRDNFKGQITFFAREVIEEVATRTGIQNIDASSFRRNIVTSGVDLNELIGSEFEIDGVRFSGVEECAPCFWMNEAVGEGVEDLLKGRGGLRCRILKSGTLTRGEKELRLIA